MSEQEAKKFLCPTSYVKSLAIAENLGELTR